MTSKYATKVKKLTSDLSSGELMRLIKAKDMPSVVFLISYILVVLPFTIRFFKEFSNINDVISAITEDANVKAWLNILYTIVLGAFLGFLEYTSINLGIRIWQMSIKEGKLYAVILCFFACQSLPVLSTYYEISNVKFLKVKTQLDTDKKDIEKQFTQKLTNLNGQLDTKKEALEKSRSERSNKINNGYKQGSPEVNQIQKELNKKKQSRII
jgi:hypothetical protein